MPEKRSSGGEKDDGDSARAKAKRQMMLGAAVGMAAGRAAGAPPAADTADGADDNNDDIDDYEDDAPTDGGAATADDAAARLRRLERYKAKRRAASHGESDKDSTGGRGAGGDNAARGEYDDEVFEDEDDNDDDDEAGEAAVAPGEDEDDEEEYEYDRWDAEAEAAELEAARLADEEAEFEAELHRFAADQKARAAALRLMPPLLLKIFDWDQVRRAELGNGGIMMSALRLMAPFSPRTVLGLSRTSRQLCLREDELWQRLRTHNFPSSANANLHPFGVRRQRLTTRCSTASARQVLGERRARPRADRRRRACAWPARAAVDLTQSRSGEAGEAREGARGHGDSGDQEGVRGARRARGTTGGGRSPALWRACVVRRRKSLLIRRRVVYSL